MADFDCNTNTSRVMRESDHRRHSSEATERNDYEADTLTNIQQKICPTFENHGDLTSSKANEFDRCMTSSHERVFASKPDQNSTESEKEVIRANNCLTSAILSQINPTDRNKMPISRSDQVISSDKVVKPDNFQEKHSIGIDIQRGTSLDRNCNIPHHLGVQPGTVDACQLRTSPALKSTEPSHDHLSSDSMVNGADTSPSSKWTHDNTNSAISVTKTADDFTRRPAPLDCTGYRRMLRRLGHVFSPGRALEELRSPLFWHDVVAETVLCMYYECLIVFISVTFNRSVYSPSITHFGLYAGFFVFACIEGWGPMCGASVNPARTWAVFLTGRMTFIKALVYTIVEIGGAAAGTMVGYGLTPSNATDQIIPLLPGEGVSAVRGMAIEAVLTFNLIFVGLVLGHPSSQPSPTASLTIGFCVGTGVMAAGTHTGGLQNPIVAFGPAIVSGNFTDHWLYWVGPYVGSTVACVFYLSLKFVRETYEPKNRPDYEMKREKSEISTSL